MPNGGPATVEAERLRLQRTRERQAGRTLQTVLEAELQQRREEEERRREEMRLRHEREMEERRMRHQLALERTRAGAAIAASTRGATLFTPPQAFLSGGAATRVPGAPAMLDVAIALGSAAMSSAWVVTRDHSSGADVAWAAFLGVLGVVMMVEGHGEAHDAGVGVAGSMAGYLAARLLGGTQQPGV